MKEVGRYESDGSGGWQRHELSPLTGVIPKPIAPVAGKPVMQHIFELLAKAGYEEIHVDVHYLADVIFEFYGRETRVGGASRKVSGTLRLWPARRAVADDGQEESAGEHRVEQAVR